MKKVRIGDMTASAVALGCMRMANVDIKTRDEIINTALELGIDFFDHADIYGGGKSEEMFGEFLKNNPGVRSKIKIQTKCGIRKGFYDFSKKHIISSVENSLKRLNTDYLDVLVLHRPDTLIEPAEVAEAFDVLYSSGKVKNFGVSNHNPMQIELLKTAVKQPILVNQLQYSIPECGMVTSGLNVNMKNAESQMHDGSVLEYSRIKNITIQTWSPFQKGFIDGTFIDDMENYPEINDKLRAVARKYCVTPATIAAAWILRHPANMQLITGTMNTEHLKDVFRGSQIIITREEWYDIYRSAGYSLP